MKKYLALVMTIVSLLMIFSCEQPTGSTDTEITHASFKINNQSFTLLEEVKWGGNNFGNLDSGDVEENYVQTGSSYIFFTKENSSVKLRTKDLVNVSSNGDFIFTDNTPIVSEDENFDGTLRSLINPIITYEEDTEGTYWVTIHCNTSGSKLYYTVDGSTPDFSSNKYTKPFSINVQENGITVKAVALDSSEKKSQVVEKVFPKMGSVVQPVIEDSERDENGNIRITLKTETKGATIYYTIDGSEPTKQSREYENAFDINIKDESVVVKAIAVKNGMENSTVTMKIFSQADMVATPIIATQEEWNPVSGEKGVTLSCDTPWATMYYTTDGSTPATSEKGTTKAYTEKFSINLAQGDVTVKAIARVVGKNNSAIAEEVFKGTVAAPVITNEAWNGETGERSVSISTKTTGATVYYVVKTGENVSVNKEYTEPFTVTIKDENVVVSAIAKKQGLLDSHEVEQSFAKAEKLTSPSISSSSIEATNSIEVTIESDTEGSEIYYTLDGTEPTTESTKYTGKRTLDSTNFGTKVLSIIVKDGFLNSEIAEHILAKPGQVASPLIKKDGAVTGTGVKTVELICDTIGANLYYTIDGSEPTKESTQYTGAFTIELKDIDVTVKAFAVKNDKPDSYVSTAVFAKLEKTAKPTIKKDCYVDGIGKKTIELDCDTVDASIFYTVDGSEPTRESRKYTDSFTIDLSTSNVVVKAIAVTDNTIDSSIAVEEFVTLAQVQPPIIATDGEVDENAVKTVKITCPTQDSSIYYTLDGREPSILSTKYSESFTINLKNTDIVVKAIAVKNGMLNSSIETQTFRQIENSFLSMIRVSGEDMYDYSIGKYEVTQAQWQTIMRANPANSFGVGDNIPVYNVSWYDAIVFCNALSIEEDLEPVYYTGYSYPSSPNITKNTNLTSTPKADFTKNGYRLPTEEEWEWAASSGQENGTSYAGTSTESELTNYAWYSENNGTYGSTTFGNKEVGLKEANSLGIYDMSGNVEEWCWDAEEYGTNKIVKGGNWADEASNCLVNASESKETESTDRYQGFRVVRTNQVYTPTIITNGNWDGVNGDKTVSLTCKTDGAKIYYTINGTTPSASSTLYEGQFELPLLYGDIPVKVIAIKEEFIASDMTDYLFNKAEKVESPVITNGAWDGAHGIRTVELACATEGASIYYTTDGGVPATRVIGTTKKYTAPFEIDISTSQKPVKAIAVKDCMLDSSIESKVYAKAEKVTQPVINTGIVDGEGNITVNISCATEGASIYYTTGTSDYGDGNWIEYTCSFDVNIKNSSQTVKAIAINTDMVDSVITTKIITQVVQPVISTGIVDGEGNITVSISCATEGASIYYTTGTSDYTEGDWIKYSTSFDVNTKNSSQTIKAISIKTGMVDSVITTKIITQAEQVVQPVISTGIVDGEGNITVSISCATEGASIYYTTFTSDYTEGVGIKYSTSFDVNTKNSSQTIKVFAIKTGMLNSVITTKIIAQAKQVEQPEIIVAKTFREHTNVAITCATEGTTFKYRLNEGTWITYTNEIPIENTTTIEARAYKDGMIDSDISSKKTIEEFYITFDKNNVNVSGTMTSQEVVEGVETVLKENCFTVPREYGFEGWSTSSDGSVEYVDGYEITITNDLILYAKWQPLDYTTTTLSIDMKGINGGTFTRSGTNVTVSDFYMSETEVTQAQWEAVMTDRPFSSPNSEMGVGDDLPAYYISWYDAVEFCNALSEKEGLTPVYTIDKETEDPNNTNSDDAVKWAVTADFTKNGYRLPTDAEWEYAAGGGAGNRTVYAGTDSFSDLGDYAWYSVNNGRYGNSDYGTKKVGRKLPNRLGIYDMSGNVNEWCWDWYASYDESATYNPIGADSGTNRVLRGGSWVSDVYDCQVNFRSFDSPSGRGLGNGFRVARSL